MRHLYGKVDGFFRKLGLGGGLIAALVAIVLGVIGNAMWEWAIRPGLGLASHLVLDLASLGIQSIKTSTYEWISRGGEEALAGESIPFWWTIAVIGLGYAFITLLSKPIEAERNIDELEREIDQRKSPPQTTPNPSLEDIRQRLQGMRGRVRRIRRLAYVTLGLWTLNVGVMIGGGARAMYVHRAVAFAHQMYDRAAPAMSEHDRLLARAHFAAIGNRDDYVRYIDSLRPFASSLELGPLPQFDPW